MLADRTTGLQESASISAIKGPRRMTWKRTSDEQADHGRNVGHKRLSGPPSAISSITSARKNAETTSRTPAMRST